MDNKKQFIKEFEHMRNMSELKALSNYSLENPLTDGEYNKMMELKDYIKENSFSEPTPSKEVEEEPEEVEAEE